MNRFFIMTFLSLGLFQAQSLRAQRDLETAPVQFFVGLQSDLSSSPGLGQLGPLRLQAKGAAYQFRVGASMRLPFSVPGDVQVFAGYRRKSAHLDIVATFRDIEEETDLEGQTQLALAWHEVALGGQLFLLNNQPVRPYIAYTQYLGRIGLNASLEGAFDDSFESWDVDLTSEELLAPVLSGLNLGGSKRDISLGAECQVNPWLGCFIQYTFRSQRINVDVADLQDVLEGIEESFEELERQGFDVDPLDIEGLEGDLDLMASLKTSFPTVGVRLYF